MDLINELKQIENNISISNFIENFKEEQIKLDKKIHILKVITLSKEMMLIQSEVSKDKVLGVDLSCYRSDGVDKFSIHLLNHEQKKIKAEPQLREKFQNLIKLLKDYIKINSAYVSDSFKNDKGGIIFFDKDVNKQMFDLLLNEELRKTLDYSQLSIQLENKAHNISRPKL